MSEEEGKTLEDFEARWRDFGLDETLKLAERTLTIVPPEQSPRAGVVGPLRKLETQVDATFPELLMTGTLGEGGMGIVRLAQQTALGREVAVKTLRTEAGLRTDAISDLLSEACITGVLEHPNIVPIYTLGEGSNGEPLVVMKRIVGRSWREFFQNPDLIDFSEFGDALGWHIHVLMQVCNAVHYAHSKSILHRDLKPENVMVGGFGEICLLDWGIAVSVGETHGDRFPRSVDVNSPAGTPAYMAPEMASGLGAKLCVQTDVYLLGALLHEIITGRAPHEGETVMQVLFAAFLAKTPMFDPEVPEGLAAICKRAMDPDPQERFASAETFRRALAEFVRHRESIKLGQEAARKLQDLHQLVVRETQEDSNLLIHQTFVESRFGFDQALRIWPENPLALDQKEELILTMCEFELSQDNVAAAIALVGQLREPPSDLQKRIEVLHREWSRQTQELETLRKAARENDISVEAKRRGIFLGLFGLAAVMWRVPTLLMGQGAMELDRDIYLALLLPYGILIGVLAYFGRNVFFANRANRHAFFALLLVFGAAAFQRVIVFVTQKDPHVAITNELLLYSVAILLAALTIERRLVWSAIPFVLGYVLASMKPLWALDVFGFAAGGGLMLMSLIWLLPQRNPQV